MSTYLIIVSGDCSSELVLKRWRNKSAAQLLAAEWFRHTVVCRGMVPRHRRQSRNSSAKTKFFKSPRRTLSEYPCGGLARTLFSAFPRRKFRQSAADPIGSAAEQICSAAVRRVRGGFRGGIFCSAAKLNLADSAGVRRGPARTQADPGGVRGGIAPPWELPICQFFTQCSCFAAFCHNRTGLLTAIERQKRVPPI